MQKCNVTPIAITLLLLAACSGSTHVPSGGGPGVATTVAQAIPTMPATVPPTPAATATRLIRPTATITNTAVAIQPASVKTGQPTLAPSHHATTAASPGAPNGTLTLTPASSSTPTVGVDRANLRAGPGVNYPTTGVASGGQTLDIVASDAGRAWYELQSGNWIAAPLVQNAPGVPVESHIPTPAPSTTLASAVAAGPPPTASAGPAAAGSWQGEYFTNQDLSGTPALVRNDPDVNFDWSSASPDPLIPANHFSVRWTQAASFTAGQWRFQATADDGVRVYVDGIPIIDQWQDTAPVTYTTSIVLSSGNHDLRVDYYRDTGQSRIHVWWAPDDGSPTDPAHTGSWRGEYFTNPGESGTPTFERDDPWVYFDWGTNGPGWGINGPGSGIGSGTTFSAHWTRQVFFPGGTYVFSVEANGGVRLWLDWAAIIDQSQGAFGQTYTKKIYNLGRGNHMMAVDYSQAAGTAASVRLTWQDASVGWVGNLHTCMRPQKSWIKVYRLGLNDQWQDMNANGYGLVNADGTLTIWGVPIDAVFGWDGQPYKVELWEDNQVVRTEGDIMAGQPELRIMPGTNVQTSWPCGANIPTQ